MFVSSWFPLVLFGAQPTTCKRLIELSRFTSASTATCLSYLQCFAPEAMGTFLRKPNLLRHVQGWTFMLLPISLYLHSQTHDPTKRLEMTIWLRAPPGSCCQSPREWANMLTCATARREASNQVHCRKFYRVDLARRSATSAGGTSRKSSTTTNTAKTNMTVVDIAAAHRGARKAFRGMHIGKYTRGRSISFMCDRGRWARRIRGFWIKFGCAGKDTVCFVFRSQRMRPGPYNMLREDRV